VRGRCAQRPFSFSSRQGQLFRRQIASGDTATSCRRVVSAISTTAVNDDADSRCGLDGEHVAIHWPLASICPRGPPRRGVLQVTRVAQSGAAEMEALHADLPGSRNVSASRAGYSCAICSPPPGVAGNPMLCGSPGPVVCPRMLQDCAGRGRVISLLARKCAWHASQPARRTVSADCSLATDFSWYRPLCSSECQRSGMSSRRISSLATREGGDHVR